MPGGPLNLNSTNLPRPTSQKMCKLRKESALPKLQCQGKEQSITANSYKLQVHYDDDDDNLKKTVIAITVHYNHH